MRPCTSTSSASVSPIGVRMELRSCSSVVSSRVGFSSYVSRLRRLGALPAFSLLALGACSGPAENEGTQSVVSAVSGVDQVKRGEELFDTAFAGTNGRSCATCHVRGEHTVL